MSRVDRYEIRQGEIWDKDDQVTYRLPVTVNTICSLLNMQERENARYVKLKTAVENALERGSIDRSEVALRFLVET